MPPAPAGGSGGMGRATGAGGGRGGGGTGRGAPPRRAPPGAPPGVSAPFSTTKARGEGTGLGLSVSLGIVEQHGGVLRAENRTGPGERGARFTILLPFLDRRAVRRIPATPERRKELVRGGAGSGARRVLIVDDEGVIRAAIRRYLERCGWSVEEAANGREAIQVLGLDDGGRPRLDRYHAIVSDPRAAGLAGVES